MLTAELLPRYALNPTIGSFQSPSRADTNRGVLLAESEPHTWRRKRAVYLLFPRTPSLQTQSGGLTLSELQPQVVETHSKRSELLILSVYRNNLDNILYAFSYPNMWLGHNSENKQFLFNYDTTSKNIKLLRANATSTACPKSGLTASTIAWLFQRASTPTAVFSSETYAINGSVDGTRNMAPAPGN